MSGKLSDLGVRVQHGAYMKVPTTRQLVTSSMTSRDYDLILMTSQYSESSYSENRNQIDYLCGPFKHTH